MYVLVCPVFVFCVASVYFDIKINVLLISATISTFSIVWEV